MKHLKIVGLVLGVLLLVGIVVAPIGPLPGFFIGGTAAAPPAQWPATDDVHEIRLRVGGSIPRVVIIWVVEYDGELHVVGSRDSGWVSMLGEGGPVEMRLGDQTYPLSAVRVTEGFDDVLQAYVAKYTADYPDIVAGFPSAEAAGDSVRVFRLERGASGSD